MFYFLVASDQLNDFSTNQHVLVFEASLVGRRKNPRRKATLIVQGDPSWYFLLIGCVHTGTCYRTGGNCNGLDDA